MIDCRIYSYMKMPRTRIREELQAMNLPSKALVGSCMICPSFQQQLHHLEAAMIRGCPKSRYALLVHCVLEYHHRSHPKEHTKHFILPLAFAHICAPFVCITFEFYAIVCINIVLCPATP